MDNDTQKLMTEMPITNARRLAEALENFLYHYTALYDDEFCDAVATFFSYVGPNVAKNVNKVAYIMPLDSGSQHIPRRVVSDRVLCLIDRATKEMNQEELIATIAHEAAHAYLGHNEDKWRIPEQYRQQEDEAWDQCREWLPNEYYEILDALERDGGGNRGVGASEPSQVAVHEAGHAVIATVLDVAVETVTIKPRPEANELGSSRSEGPCGRIQDGVIVLEDDEVRNEIEILYAAFAAEIHHFPNNRRKAEIGRGSDDEEAGHLLEALKESEEVYRDRANRLVEQHWPAIVLVALELDQWTTLDGSDVDSLIELSTAKGDEVDEILVGIARANAFLKPGKMATLLPWPCPL